MTVAARRERAPPGAEPAAPYVLDEQVGFILRQASQRHASLFAARLGDITPTQWATLSKLYEVGPTSQNRLGRLTAMDVATIKGVADRLMKRGFVCSQADDADARRRLLALTDEGSAFVAASFPDAFAVSAETLAPLTARERAVFVTLLTKLT